MVLDLTSRTEKLLTRLGMWGAVRGSSLVVALILSVALLESLAPSVVRLLSPESGNVVHVFAVGIGLLLGMIGYFAGDIWDRVVFEACYGPQGKWLDAIRKPFLVFPAGSALKQARAQAAQALPRKPDTPDTEKGVYREAVKIARRQAERWERASADPLPVSAGTAVALPLRGFPGPMLRCDPSGRRRRDGGPAVPPGGRGLSRADVLVSGPL